MGQAVMKEDCQWKKVLHEEGRGGLVVRGGKGWCLGWGGSGNARLGCCFLCANKHSSIDDKGRDETEYVSAGEVV